MRRPSDSSSNFRKLFVIGVFAVTIGYGAFVLLAPGPAELAQERVNRAVAAVSAYRAETGELPPSLEAVVEAGYLESQTDNFGYNLIYRRFRRDFEIFSVGPDGVPATRDDIRAGGA